MRDGRAPPVVPELAEAQGITLDVDGQPLHWSYAYAPAALAAGGVGGEHVTAATAAAGRPGIEARSVRTGGGDATAPAPTEPEVPQVDPLAVHSAKPRFWQRLYRRKSQARALDVTREREKVDRELEGCSFSPALESSASRRKRLAQRARHRRARRAKEAQEARQQLDADDLSPSSAFGVRTGGEVSPAPVGAGGSGGGPWWESMHRDALATQHRNAFFREYFARQARHERQERC